MLLAVGDPDVFDLGGVLEEEASPGVAWVEPVDLAAFVGEDLFEISCGKSFCGGTCRGVGEGPEGVYVVVFGESLQEFARAAGDDVHRACGEIAGFEELIEVGGDERVEFAGDGYCRVAYRYGWHDRGDETQERCFLGAEDADGADGFVHR